MGTLSTSAAGALLAGRVASSSIQGSPGGGGGSSPSPPAPTALAAWAGSFAWAGVVPGPMVRSRSISSILRSWRMACWLWFQRPNTARAIPATTITVTLAPASSRLGWRRFAEACFGLEVGCLAGAGCRSCSSTGMLPAFENAAGVTQTSTSIGFSGSNTRLSTCSALSSQ